MSSTQTDTELQGEKLNIATHDHVAEVNNGINGTKQSSPQGAAPYPPHFNPLSLLNTGESARFPAFGGEFQPGLYKPPTREFGNPVPLGLSAFALTLFLLSLINVQSNGVTKPNIVLASAFGYSGIVQMLVGMWEIAIGNTFGATAIASYGGFWISYAILLTPGGFEIAAAYPSAAELSHAIGFFLAGWFIFTTLLLICTLRSTVAFFLLFFLVDLLFLLLMIAYFVLDDAGLPSVPLLKAGGYVGLLTAFCGWYNALAGLADTSNSFFVVPVAHFPWSEKGRSGKVKTESETV